MHNCSSDTFIFSFKRDKQMGSWAKGSTHFLPINKNHEQGGSCVRTDTRDHDVSLVGRILSSVSEHNPRTYGSGAPLIKTRAAVRV